MDGTGRSVRKQLERITEKRAYFTCYMSFCQVVVMVVAIAVYGVADISYTARQETATVDAQDGGVATVTRTVNPNFWIGEAPAGFC